MNHAHKPGTGSLLRQAIGAGLFLMFALVALIYVGTM